MGFFTVDVYFGLTLTGTISDLVNTTSTDRRCAFCCCFLSLRFDKTIVAALLACSLLSCEAVASVVAPVRLSDSDGMLCTELVAVVFGCIVLAADNGGGEA